MRTWRTVAIVTGLLGSGVAAAATVTAGEDVAAALRREGQGDLDRAADARQRAADLERAGSAAYKNGWPQRELARAHDYEQRAAQRFAAAAQIGQPPAAVSSTAALPPQVEKYERMAQTYERTGGGYVYKSGDLVRRYDGLARKHAGLPPASAQTIPPAPANRRPEKPVEDVLNPVR